MPPALKYTPVISLPQGEKDKSDVMMRTRWETKKYHPQGEQNEDAARIETCLYQKWVVPREVWEWLHAK